MGLKAEEYGSICKKSTQHNDLRKVWYSLCSERGTSCYSIPACRTNTSKSEGYRDRLLDELRGSLDKLDAEKQYVPYCAVGMRGYLAHRILAQNGFRSKNLSGGFRTFSGAKEQIMRESEDEKLWLGE